MPDWSIKIVPSPTGSGAAFQPDVQGAKPGDPLRAQQDDLVSWNNTTQETHQPWQTDSNFQMLPEAWVYAHPPDLYMSDPIPAKRSSTPAYDVAQPKTYVPPPNNTPPPMTGPPPKPPTSWTIFYCCKTHPNRASERGRIVATVIPGS